MLLRRELEAISMPFKTSSDSESDYRNGGTANDKKKKKKSAKIKDKIEEINDSEHRERLFFRPGVIDEEPDSMDSIISDPSVFPITIVPAPTSGGGVLIRSTTAQSSVSRLSRISSSSRYVRNGWAQAHHTNRISYILQTDKLFNPAFPITHVFIAHLC